MVEVINNINYIGPHKQDMKIITPNWRYPKNLPTDILPIIALDPGGITGFSVLILPRGVDGRDLFSWSFDKILQNKIMWFHGELNFRDAESEGAYQICKMIDTWPSACVVIEDFILHGNRQEKSRELLSPVRITAKIESHMWTKCRKILLQSASQAKTTITDDRLRIWGCYTSVGGLQHARDADRHALLFLRRCMGPQGNALRSVAWPHIFMSRGNSEIEIGNEY